MTASEIYYQLEISNFVIDKKNNLSGSLVQYLKDNYHSLSNKSESEIIGIILGLKEPVIYNLKDLNPTSRILSDACDTQFESDFRRIHRAYDFAAAACIATVLTGNLPGLITCESFALVNMMLAMAEAMDNHSNCQLG